ncbi:FecR domain-containing protein [Tsuneonella flava]|uniref:FecR domain-containing protein n=1 Tax=Tsuneonella flava TaxID=2055955 RepID=A0ABX7KE31_9SPHN|nr:FecR domain-containing protein [Tsuneonella flava]QSB45822.1 FecR domain-containing protein [Tsuneonella flava]
MKRRHTGLGERAPEVFERLFDNRSSALHPADAEEAADFWDQLGQFERPPLSHEMADAPQGGWFARSKSPRWLAAAAAVAAFLTTGAVIYSQREAPASLPGLTQLADAVIDREEPGHTYTAGRGQRSIIALSDGSEVTLAPESTITVHYTEKQRLIRLIDGEALFRVAHNKARPFIVKAAGGEVMAVGTAFDVRLRDKSKAAQVTVVDGVIRISVAAPHKETGSEIARLARKGEQVEFGSRPDGKSAQGFIGASSEVNLDLSVVWTNGMLFFDGEPLEEAIRIANRYSSQNIVLKDQSLRNVPVYGLIRQGDTAALSDIIEHPGALRVERSDSARLDGASAPQSAPKQGE